MEAPLWLLLGWGGIGAIDFVYNHIYRYRLHAHASSFREHGVHTLLTLVLTVTVVMLVFVEMGKVGFGIFLGIQGPCRDLHPVGCVNRAEHRGHLWEDYRRTNMCCIRLFFCCMEPLCGR